VRKRSAAADDALTARLRVEARSAHRLVPVRHSVRAWRPAQPVWLQAARRAEVRRREASKVQVESATLPVAARPEAVVLLRRGEEAWASAAAEVGRKAPRPADPRTLAAPAAAVLAEEWDALAAARPRVAAHAEELPSAGLDVPAGQAVGAVSAVAVAPLREAAAELDAAVAPLRAAAAELDETVPLPAEVARAEVEEVVRRQAARAEVEEVARRRVAPDAAVVVVPRQAVPGEVVAPRAAVAWACRPDQRLPGLGPRQAARSPRAMQERSTASP
jgi:hypothetical protein